MVLRLTPNHSAHAPQLNQHPRRRTTPLRLLVMRRDIIITQLRLRSEGDNKRHRHQNQTTRQTNGQIMSMALLPRQHKEGGQEEDVADQGADGQVRGETDAPLKGRGEEVGGGRAGEAAGFAAVGGVGVGEGGTEAGGDV